MVALTAHQYDDDGWLLGRWWVVVDLSDDPPGVQWDVLVELAEYIDRRARREVEGAGFGYDPARTVWWMPGPGDDWPAQPVTLPFRA